ncbi:hypothetical protein BGW36DRAFT_372106 [Talaromyces proteolyticus]|uniref:Uncharacterized protein n=1 Tax=Talaromyces proteolyticus TaxID=1131652 RepID=A0AAD4Q196_9EURO|nr:uncharacterized protein BGW36DRAFT_372106 [Talaromyces proteolyticus]KAH8702049.1 hypothetical protein BGW36DRAFT_372106 [Talaromyces proteolyticus]
MTRLVPRKAPIFYLIIISNLGRLRARHYFNFVFCDDPALLPRPTLFTPACRFSFPCFLSFYDSFPSCFAESNRCCVCNFVLWSSSS